MFATGLHYNEKKRGCTIVNIIAMYTCTSSFQLQKHIFLLLCVYDEILLAGDNMLIQ